MKQNQTGLGMLALALLLCCGAGCAVRREAQVCVPVAPAQPELPRRIGATLDLLASHPTAGEQVILVEPDPALPSRGTLYAVSRAPSGWQLALAPAPANLGKEGVAPPWEKREGDGRTPAGIFPVGEAFGYLPSADTRLPYRQTTPQDLWVDDPLSPDYNRWARRGETGARHFEALLRPDPLYRHALVVGYNSAPVVRDLGSAIFIHLERGPGSPTSGCVSLPEGRLLELSRWLDPGRHPRVAIGSPRQLELAASGLGPLLPADLPAGLRRRLTQAERPLALRRGGEDGFFGAAVTLPPEVERRMLDSGSWRPGCPVGPGELAYLVLAHRGFDGSRQYGELVLHAALCAFVLDALEAAWGARFPIAGMRLIEEFGADDELSMAADNSSAFNCRSVPGKPGVFSRHSYGTALDLNPLENPYLQADALLLTERGLVPGQEGAFLAGLGCTGPGAWGSFCGGHPDLCRVHPPASLPFLDRSRPRPGMLLPGAALSSFLGRGFTWGGSWRFPDYQHLEFHPASLNGR